MNLLSKCGSGAFRALRSRGLSHLISDFAAEILFDLRHGIETTLPRAPEMASPNPDRVQYQGASPRLVRQLFRSLPAAAVQADFVDIGCGRGRVLILAAQFGFPRVWGIELCPTLAEAAQRHLNRIYPGSTGRSWQVLTMDAATYPIPSGPVVLFLYNPFGGPTLRRLTERIRLRTVYSHEPLWVIYLNPVDLPAFAEVGLEAHACIYRRQEVAGVILAAAGCGLSQNCNFVDTP